MPVIHHFSFTVSDVERAVAFYTEVLGFTLPRAIRDVEADWISVMTGMPDTHLRIAFLELSGTNLELIEYVTPRGTQQEHSQTSDIASAHVAFQIDDMDTLRLELEKRGARFVSDPVTIPEGPWMGRRVVYLRDPDGIVIELVEVPAEGGT
jgi:catechol 2,3-dioxygenase-like lactoylglutathione lyase family enzyme